MVSAGLEGVVAAATELSLVDGEHGELVIAGYPIEELAEHATFEETTWLLWHGRLPSARELAAFHDVLKDSRDLPDAAAGLLQECARKRLAPMEALRIAAGTLSLSSDAPHAIVARVPTIIAAYARLLGDAVPIPPRADLRHAANFLYMLRGDTPAKAAAVANRAGAHVAARLGCSLAMPYEGDLA